jgi:hypothetical protein
VVQFEVLLKRVDELWSGYFAVSVDVHFLPQAVSLLHLQLLIDPERAVDVLQHGTKLQLIDCAVFVDIRLPEQVVDLLLHVPTTIISPRWHMWGSLANLEYFVVHAACRLSPCTHGEHTTTNITITSTKNISAHVHNITITSAVRTHLLRPSSKQSSLRYSNTSAALFY